MEIILSTIISYIPVNFSFDDRSMDEMNTVEDQLDGDGEIILQRRRKGDTEKVRNLAKKLSRDVSQLKKEKEEYSV